MIATKNLQNKLQAIGFQRDDSEMPSVIFVSELGTINSNLTPFHYLELERAASFKADAVFFRYFEDNRPPLPQIYIYDKSNINNTENYISIHKELWSNSLIPTFIVVEQSNIKIFDCRKPVKILSNGKLSIKEIALIDLNDIASIANVLEIYNIEKFKNGSFWESDEANKNYNSDNTAYKILLAKLRDLRKSYNNNNRISSRLFDYVIIISTLVKFLEENGMDENGENLAGKFFQEQVQCESFIEILKQNKIVEILEKLSIKFNGGIFNLSEEEKKEISQADLCQIINFFDTSIDNKQQLALWNLYSFKNIPVELISNLYEEFLPPSDTGAVYTPNHLVNFLIDECLPIPTWNEITNCQSINKKTIDISCGSGIFLVNCFKRLVQIYKVNKFYKENSFPEKTGIDILQQILIENIFGVDINPNAVALTKFSLQLALCQMLSPKQIWTELEFQDLGKENILRKDFFNYISDTTVHSQFDLVIGNPPFNPPPKEDGSKNEKQEYFEEIVQEHKILPYPIRNHNIALLFLQLSVKLLKPIEGMLCLIQPAISLLHNKKNQQFRKKLFEENNVLQVIDFTTVRRVLYNGATTATCAIFIQNKPRVKNDVTHIVVRRTNSIRKKLFFEIDTYDIHSINYEDTIYNYSWKCNLFGGYRLFRLIQNLENSKKLKIYYNKHKCINYIKLKNIVNIQQDLCFETKLTEGIFPKYVDENTKDNAKVLWLMGDKDQIEFLKKYLNDNSALLASYIAGTSSRQGLEWPYDLVLSDILNLPIIKNPITIADKILTADIVKYKISEFGQGENFETNEEIKIIKNELPSEIADFSNTLSDALNSIYLVGNKKISLCAAYSTSACFVVCFEYGENTCVPNEIVKDNTLDLTTLIGDKDNKTTLIKKITIIHRKFENKIYIIKPKQLRYWLKSTALMDADTIISDIINLNMLNDNDL